MANDKLVNEELVWIDVMVSELVVKADTPFYREIEKYKSIGRKLAHTTEMVSFKKLIQDIYGQNTTADLVYETFPGMYETNRWQPFYILFHWETESAQIPFTKCV